MKSCSKLLLTGACTLMLAGTAHAANQPAPAANRAAANNGGGGGAGGNQDNALSWCRDKEHCVLAQLAAPGRVGRITLYSKTSTGGYQQAASCAASGGVDNHSDGAPSMKTPAGVYGVLETADQLTYNGRLVNMYDATYFKDPDLLNIRTSNRLAIHTGHVAGQNSHGCIRTTGTCADAIRNAADNSGNDLRIKVQY